MHVEDPSPLLYKASTLLGPGTAASMTFCTYSEANSRANFAHTVMLEHGAEPDVGVMRPSRVLVRSRVLVPSRVLVTTDLTHSGFISFCVAIRETVKGGMRNGSIQSLDWTGGLTFELAFELILGVLRNSLMIHIMALRISLLAIIDSTLATP